MYPTVVIVLIDAQHSITDICEISSSNASKLVGPVASEVQPATLGHLSFAAGPVHSTTDNEAKSQRSCALRSRDGQEHGLEEAILKVTEHQVGTNNSWLIPLQSLALQRYIPVKLIIHVRIRDKPRIYQLLQLEMICDALRKKYREVSL